MAKKKIEVLDAVIDGHGKGEQLEVDEKSAEYLIEIGYAKEVIVETKPATRSRSKKSE
jgi:hypothetical protein